jgi:hypothetical protein
VTATSSARPSCGSAGSVELEKALEQENAGLAEIQREQKMLNEEVTEEDVAQVVSKWTGIRPQRLMEGEMAKLVHLEETLHRRVVGQDEAVSSVAKRDPALRAPGCPTRRGPSARSCSWAPRASVRPSSRERSPSSCSTTSARSCAST